jgi:hypothetical protein
MVFSARMNKDGLEDCRLIPCTTGVNGPVAMLKPTEGEGAVLAETLRRLSEPLGTRVEAGAEEIRVRPS